MEKTIPYEDKSGLREMPFGEDLSKAADRELLAEFARRVVRFVSAEERVRGMPAGAKLGRHGLEAVTKESDAWNAVCEMIRTAFSPA